MKDTDAAFFDIICVNQIDSQADLPKIAQTVKESEEVLVFLDDEGTPFTRVWCIFEIVLAVMSDKTELKFPHPDSLRRMGIKDTSKCPRDQLVDACRDTKEVFERLLKRGIDIEKANATNPADK